MVEKQIIIILMLFIQIVLLFFAIYKTKYVLGIPSNIVMLFMTICFLFYTIGCLFLYYLL